MGHGQSVEAARATRVDKDAGIREEVGFIGSGPERIFSTLHAPLSEPIGAVLLCSSILAELLAGYQEEVWLCRGLAQRGYWVRRFHYRGAGHSDGDADELTFSSIREDALTLTDLLREETGMERLALVGTRAGALVAASIGAAFRGSPMAFVQPVLKGEALFKEISRARAIWLSREEGRSKDAPTPEDMLSILERDRRVDVLGYPLTDRLYQSLRSLTLADELGSEPRPIQIVQVAKRKVLSSDYERFVDTLGGKGFATDVALVGDEISWWFDDTRRHLLPEIGDAIIGWLTSLIAQEGDAMNAPAG